MLSEIAVVPKLEAEGSFQTTIGESDDVRYSSPEYVTEGILTVKSDVYSFACLILGKIASLVSLCQH